MSTDVKRPGPREGFAALPAELDAGRFDSAPVLLAIEKDAPLARLFRAVAYARAGRPTEALADVAGAEAGPSPSVSTRVAAARVRFAVGDYEGALASLDRAAEAGAGASSEAAAAVLDWKFDFLRRLGWYPEAIAAMDRALALDPKEPSRRRKVAELHYVAQDYDRALAHLRAAQSAELALAGRGDDKSQGAGAQRTEARASIDRLQIADTLRRLGRYEETQREIELAFADKPLSSHPSDVKLHLDGIVTLIEATRYEAAERYLIELLGKDERCVQALLLLAHLRSWVGDHAGALRHADAALAAAAEAARNPPAATTQQGPRERLQLAPAHRVRGAAHVAAGRFEEGAAELVEALRLDPRDSEAHVWLAEARLRQDRLDEAFASINTGAELSVDSTDYLSAMLLRLITQAKMGRFPGMPEYLVREAIEMIFPVGAGVNPSDQKRLLPIFERALTALRGNRAYNATFVRDADDPPRLLPIPIRSSPRTPAKQALWLYATVGTEAAIEAFAAIHRQFPASPEPYCYHGELYLYRGEYDEARRNFEAALAIYPRTRWAFIGLGGVAVLEGRHAEALEILARGVQMSGGPGPTTFIYRGEARRKIGDLDGAIVDLEQACRMNPSRVSAWANLALARDARGEHGAVPGIFETLKRQAPGFVADALREADLPADSTSETAGAAGLRRLFETILAMQRGNRSSTCVTYYTREGQLRVVPPMITIDAHSTDRDLHQLRSTLERSAGLRRG